VFGLGSEMGQGMDLVGLICLLGLFVYLLSSKITRTIHVFAENGRCDLSISQTCSKGIFLPYMNNIRATKDIFNFKIPRD
jgi:hypothetical protein